MHLFINANSLYNCWFYTSVGCFVKHNTLYQISTEIKGHLLNSYIFKHAYRELFREGNMGFEMDFFHIYMCVCIYIYICVCIYIRKSVAAHTSYVQTNIREIRIWDNIAVNIFQNI